MYVEGGRVKVAVDMVALSSVGSLFPDGRIYWGVSLVPLVRLQVVLDFAESTVAAVKRMAGERAMETNQLRRRNQRQCQDFVRVPLSSSSMQMPRKRKNKLDD